jgi:hypothetical protein
MLRLAWLDALVVAGKLQNVFFVMATKSWEDVQAVYEHSGL